MLLQEVLCALGLCDGDMMTVQDCLVAKHPPGQPVVPSEVVSSTSDSESNYPHLVVFESITGTLVSLLQCLRRVLQVHPGLMPQIGDVTVCV